MIGLTGGIATGKSTVSQYLRSLGACVLDADAYARTVIAPGTAGFEQVAAAFPEVVDGDSLDRKRLASIIFSDAERKGQLEAIIHPLVIAQLQHDGERLEKHGCTVVADVPLLFESGCQTFLTPIWVVYVDPQTQLHRLRERDGLTAEEAQRRIASQWPLDKKVALADAVIDNSGSLDRTYAQIRGLWRDICENRLNRS